MESSANLEYLVREFDLKRNNGSYPSVTGDYDPWQLWDLWNRNIFELIATDLDAGWEVDPSSWKPSCLKYECRRGFLGRKYIEIHGVTVRLRKLKKIQNT